MLYDCIMVPVKNSFETISAIDQETNKTLNMIDALIKLVFFIDIILSFRKAYLMVRSGQEIKDPVLIAKKYLKFYFWIDLLSVIPFDLIKGNPHLRMVSLVKILRLFRLKKIISFMNLNVDTRALIRITQTIMTFIVITHWATCYFLYLVNIPIDDDIREQKKEFNYDYWIPQVDLNDQVTDFYESSVST